MHILEVIIDGFKSYATRTVVSGFDPEFNAITGLNGSGKSNILDAICFVLGITNLSQVRAANLQDLVYKQGQAGVTKASVTIVFDNSDMRASPVGYEADKRLCITREVVIGGRNRYLINGKGAQASAVANLFQSVQLNVNNPHFLIMQGRITKVLNMKPPEILGMVEEAAGTRMFETKKQAALKTLEKKQAKVEEIDRVLAQDITPTLERLREEKSHYLRWSANAAEVARLERFCVAAEYSEAEAAADQKGAGADAAEKEADDLRKESDEKAAEAEAKKAEEEQCRSAKGAAGRAAARRRELQGALEAASTECARLEAARAGAAGAVEGDEARLRGEADAAEENARVEAAKTQEVAACEEALAAQDAAKAEAEGARDAAQAALHDANAGKGAGETKSVSEQLAAARQAQRDARATVKRCAARRDALAKRRADAEAAAKKHARDASGLKSAHDAAAKAHATRVQACEAHAATAVGDAGALADAAATSTAAARDAAQRVAKVEAQLRARLRFDYDDPGKGFDARKVRGVLAGLVTPSSQNVAAALEVVAGGKLYQVVVDDAATGKALLERGKLRRRVTLVPLDKVRASRIDGDRAARAAAIATKRGGDARVALEFVGYDADVAAAVEYAFGSALVCDTMETARAVAFDPKVQKRCVTLEGDVVDPRGTLSGGSKAQGLGACLGLLVELSEARARAETTGQAAAAAEDASAKASTHAEAMADLDAKRGVAEAELKAARDELQASAGGAALGALEALDDEVKALGEEAETAEQTDADATARLETLERDGKKIEQERKRELKKLDDEARAAKKRFDACSRSRAEADKRLKTAQAELRALGDETRSSGQSIDALEKALAASTKALETADAALEEAAAAKDAASAGLEEARAELDAAEAEANALAEDAAAAKKRATTCDVEAKKKAHGAQRLRTEASAAAKRVSGLAEKHAWIPAEKGFFGRAGGDYDFAARPGGAAQARADLDSLAANQDRLARKINKRVMGMIEKSERDYDDLTAKKATVARDRAKIEAVISELDVKKQETLEATWQKVNRDFGSIFASLLPGAHSKLAPPEGGTVLDGLEVKVGFGGLWKESLSELSGGQRSLIALSLVLSMLLFKPAPMYILDEVDAALDLSHTQNIGVMLRAHFKASQFVVVSLKEGMFNNANVIFRTKFVDGVSTVMRTTTKHMDDKGAKRKKLAA